MSVNPPACLVCGVEIAAAAPRYCRGLCETCGRRLVAAAKLDPDSLIRWFASRLTAAYAARGAQPAALGSVVPEPRDKCSIPGCENPSVSRGWCSKHYQRWRLHGDPDVGAQPAAAHRYKPTATARQSWDRTCKIIRDYVESGASVDDVAHRFGMSRPVALRWVQRALGMEHSEGVAREPPTGARHEH